MSEEDTTSPTFRDIIYITRPPSRTVAANVPPVTVDLIQKTVAPFFSLTQQQLLSEKRTRAISRPRHIAMWLAKQWTTRSTPDIGRRFGGRDHTTVLHGVKKIDELLLDDTELRAQITALTHRLRPDAVTLI